MRLSKPKLVKRAADLAYDIYSGPSGQSVNKSVAFMHGILGNKRNWRTPALSFQRANPDYKCIAIDLRGHGNSNAVQWQDNSVQNCAEDLAKFFTDDDISINHSSAPNILCGHSFGGKVALKFLEGQLLSGSQIPEHTWILDSIPGPYRLHYSTSSDHRSDIQSVFHVFDLLEHLPSVFESREHMIDLMVSTEVPKPVAQWLAMSIVKLPDQEGYGWGFRVPMMKELFLNFCALDMWGFLENYDGEGKIHFLRAGKNTTWTKDVLDRIESIRRKNANIELHVMPHVGHWVHAEDMLGLLNIMYKGSDLPVK
jgi:pimeloyl-ACP methyl ester carboxylesterase